MGNNVDRVPLLGTVYSGSDYPRIYDAVLRGLREIYGENYDDLTRTPQGVMLADIASYGLRHLALGLDHAAADAFLSSAVTIGSARRHAGELNVAIPFATSASGDFLFSFDPADITSQATINKGHRVTGPGGLVFTATDDVVVPVGASAVFVRVAEGEDREITFISNGRRDQTFELPGIDDGRYLADSPIRVYVDDDLWPRVPYFSFEATDQYSLDVTVTPPVLAFGNGFAGFIPPADASAFVEYRVISAEAGNIAATATGLTSVDAFTVAGVPVTVTVTAPTGTSGGEPPMDLETVRELIPDVVASAGFAVTERDYGALILAMADPTFGRVAQGYAKQVRASADDATTVGYADAITSGLAALVVVKDAQLVTAAQAATEATAALDAIDVQVAAQSISATTLGTLAGEIRVLGAGTVDPAGRVRALMESHEQAAVRLEAILAADAVATAPQLSSAQRQTVENALMPVREFATSLGARGSTMQVSGNDIVATSESIATRGAELTISAATMASDSSAARTAVVIILDELASPTTGTGNDVDVANTSIDAAVTGLLDHLDDLYASDCQSNVISVPLLTRGVDGFYAAPSSGLIDAVQKMLDRIKEVTHTVRVISGAGSLLAADITVTGRYTPDKRPRDEIRSDVEARLDDLLRGRQFAVPVYLSAPGTGLGLYDVLALVAGLDHVNVVLTGPTDRIDGDGNLIPRVLEVVTKGTFVIDLLEAE